MGNTWKIAWDRAPEHGQCPSVKPGDKILYPETYYLTDLNSGMKTDRATADFAAHVLHHKYDDLTSGCCRAYTKLALLRLSNNTYINPAWVLSVNCDKCPVIKRFGVLNSDKRKGNHDE